MRAMDAPARMTPEERGERFEREGETHMNGNGGNDQVARERRRVSGEAGEGAEKEAPGQAGPQVNRPRSC